MVNRITRTPDHHWCSGSQRRTPDHGEPSQLTIITKTTTLLTLFSTARSDMSNKIRCAQDQTRLCPCMPCCILTLLSTEALRGTFCPQGAPRALLVIWALIYGQPGAWYVVDTQPECVKRIFFTQYNLFILYNLFNLHNLKKHLQAYYQSQKKSKKPAN